VILALSGSGIPTVTGSLVLAIPVMSEGNASLTVSGTDARPGCGAGFGADAVTVMADVLVTLVVPEVAVAVIVAEPAATPVTRPLEPTVATAVLEDDQAMAAPVKAALF
jgi:pyruvate/2-oxoacid:ferredoxin oxidoreductase beta subunit